MNVKTLQALAAITVPVTALAIMLPPPQTAPAPVHGAGHLLPDLAGRINDGTTLVVTSATGRVTLRHTGKAIDAGWGLADKGGYPVMDATIKPVLDALTQLRGVEPKTERPALYGRLDLGKSAPGSDSHEVTVADANGHNVADIIFGRRKDDVSGHGHDRIYVRVADRPRAWLAEPAVTFPGDALDWIDHRILDLSPDEIRQITITQPDGASITLSRAKPGDKMLPQNLPPGAKPKTDTEGADAANAWQSLNLTDVRPASQLAGANGPTAQAVTFDGLKLGVTWQKQNGQDWATVRATGSKDAAGISSRTSGWAYQIADATAALLQTKPTDLVVLPPNPPVATKPPAAPAPPPQK